MVKIKDFTLDSKNLGGGRAPVPYSTPAHVGKKLQKHLEMTQLANVQSRSNYFN